MGNQDPEGRGWPFTWFFPSISDDGGVCCECLQLIPHPSLSLSSSVFFFFVIEPQVVAYYLSLVHAKLCSDLFIYLLYFILFPILFLISDHPSVFNMYISVLQLSSPFPLFPFESFIQQICIEHCFVLGTLLGAGTEQQTIRKPCPHGVTWDFKLSLQIGMPLLIASNIK